MKKQMPKKEKLKKHYSKGITLIALVITIIVLLILAGVSIAMLTGENGVLTKATESKEQTEIAQEKEEITLAYSAAKTNKGDKVAEDVTADELNAELDKLNSTGEASGTGTLIVTFENGHKYTIDQGTGAITGPETGEDTGEIDDKKAIKMIVNSGENGIVVLPITDKAKIDWGDGNIETVETASKNIETKKIASTNDKIKIAGEIAVGHKHEYSEKNKEYEVIISGNIDNINAGIAFIVNDETYYIDKIIEITQWGETGLTDIYLSDCTKLRKIASPSENSFTNITSFEATFFNCESLTEIPEDLFSNCPNVDSFNSTFDSCIGLNNIPQNLFSNCQNVTDFGRTFYGCTNLTGEAVPLWERVDGWESLDLKNAREWVGTKPDGNGCYIGCTKLSNYSSIPDYWKDGYNE